MIKIQLFALLTWFCFFSCEYETIKPFPPEDIDTTLQISFSEQIIPIFIQNNNCTACHPAGGAIPPDLSESNAYNSLINGGYISTESPATSKLYIALEPASENHFWKKFTQPESVLVLTWISEGAKNN